MVGGFLLGGLMESELLQHVSPSGMPEDERMTPSQSFAWSAEAGLTATEHVCTGKVSPPSVGGMAADDPQQMRERLDRIRCSFYQWRISYELHRPAWGRWVAWRIDPLEEWEAEAGLTRVVSAWDHETSLGRLGAEQRRQDELRARLRQEEEEGKSRGPLSPMRQRGEGSRGG